MRTFDPYLIDSLRLVVKRLSNAVQDAEGQGREATALLNDRLEARLRLEGRRVEAQSQSRRLKIGVGETLE